MNASLADQCDEIASFSETKLIDGFYFSGMT
jgi:hypothetical protein